jgi:hypothetical protein
VDGRAYLAPHGPDESLPDVLFEIEGPGGERKIRHATGDKKGRFKIGHVPPGIYKFKATRNGYQSVMGTIEVSAKAPEGARIVIPMNVGV